MELHVDQPGGVVGALQKGADAQEVIGLVLQHGARGHAAREVRAVFHPLEVLRRVLSAQALGQHALRFQPGLVDRFPDLGGDGAAHRAGVFARGAQAALDGGGVAGVAHHEVEHLVGVDLAVAFGVGGGQFGDAQQAAPAQLHGLGALRQQGRLHMHVEHAGGVFGAFGVTGHPEQVIGSSAEHDAFLGAESLRGAGYFSSTQVSLVPPPCEELTTSEPSPSATRVSPPGTMDTVLPDSTKGRRSRWRGAMPDST